MFRRQFISTNEQFFVILSINTEWMIAVTEQHFASDKKLSIIIFMAHLSSIFLTSTWLV